ncbi:prostaglandin F2 receptor negative regulator isoform X2 [Hoplias malabaricus]|uniref:prostaglandin F2 receptor negative regulator isoform X2 n=1 Tax=Hoplias malabaricus TaxID=27720 RepID=UPI0034618A02
MEKLLLFVIFSSGLSWGRKVSIPPGPLLRVEGLPLSLRCDVSDYEGPQEQDFDWKATRGVETIKVISTFETTFPDQSLKDRVESEDISVKRLGDSTVELRIKKTKITDSAVYTCSTPSTDSVMTGNYDASVQLRVIPDTLVLAPEAPAVSVFEGRPIILSCNISHDTTEGIYLSVTWSFKKDQSQEQDLLTFGPDVAVTVGGNFTQRYADGGMHLHLDIGGSYSLMLSGALPEDQGMYVCAASMWTREQGVWNRIQEKTVLMGQVAVVPTAESFTVQVLGSTILTVGDTLNITCLISADDYAVLSLEVTWLLNATQVLAHLGQDGVVTKTSNALSMSKVGEGIFRLEILGVGLLDMGFYSCKVRAWAQQSKGKWYLAAEKTSTPVLVSLKGPGVLVAARAIRPVISSGSTFEMTCQTRLKNIQADVALSVLILFQEGVGGPSHKLAYLSPELIFKLEDGQESSHKDSLSLVRTGKEEFRFRMQNVQLTDRGFYFCEVGVWTRQDGNEWTELVKGDSNKVSLAFEHTRPSFTVSVSSDTTTVYPWETVKIACTISVSGTFFNKDEVAYEMWWYQSGLRGPGGLNLLAYMDRWGVVKKSPRNDSSDCSVERLSEQKFALNLHGTQESDAGEYYCTATPWVRLNGVWIKDPDILSKKIFINVKFALWNSMKLPLLYGACASLTMGLFSLILGFVCARCCCRNTTQTPRSHIKLMDMAM